MKKKKNERKGETKIEGNKVKNKAQQASDAIKQIGPLFHYHQFIIDYRYYTMHR